MKIPKLPRRHEAFIHDCSAAKIVFKINVMSVSASSGKLDFQNLNEIKKSKLIFGCLQSFMQTKRAN